MTSMYEGEFTFEHVDVKEEMVQILKKELPKFNFNVKVMKADPQTHTEIPCIGINRVSDDETSESLVDGHSTLYNRNTEQYTDVFGTFFQESLEVRIWHTNADERDRLYRHTKAILFGMRTGLVEKGLLNITLRTGRDEQDTSQAQAPMALYWSTITMSYLNPLDIQYVRTIAPIGNFTAKTELPLPEGG